MCLVIVYRILHLGTFIHLFNKINYTFWAIKLIRLFYYSSFPYSRKQQQKRVDHLIRQGEKIFFSKIHLLESLKYVQIFLSFGYANLKQN